MKGWKNDRRDRLWLEQMLDLVVSDGRYSLEMVAVLGKTTEADRLPWVEELHNAQAAAVLGSKGCPLVEDKTADNKEKQQPSSQDVPGI